MKHEITPGSSVTILGVTFMDEGVELNEHIQVDGDEQTALAYLPFFERDLRRNYADLFPQHILQSGGGMPE